MQRYIAQRLALAVPTLFGVTVLIFVAMRVLPGDPLAMMGGESGGFTLTQEQLDAARASLGLDRPYYMQYLDWIGDIAHGDLGHSFWRDTPVSDLIMRRAPITIQIALMAVVLSWLIGLPLGIFSAVWLRSRFDLVSRVMILVFMAIPSFWLGLLVILTLVVFFTWRPPLGVVYLWDNPLGNLQMTIGPATVMGIGLAAQMARITRSSALEVLSQDYVRTARAKGLREWAVMSGHVLRNALLPIITISGLMFGYLLAGSVAVERAFSVPGLGLALVTAIGERDWMVIQNLVLLYGVIFVVVNLLVDLSYGWVDPRIRYQ